jgi:DNA-binding NtrC family response regulator
MAQKVLIADDDQEVLRSARAILEKNGFDVVSASDGKKAYQLLQSDEVFAAGIFDIAMPHIEGRDLVRYMQSERRLMKIPVIIMTSDLSARLSSESLSAGAVAFLPKPFTETQLMTTLGMFVKADTPAPTPNTDR